MKNVKIINRGGIGHDTTIYDKDGNDITLLLGVRSITIEVGDVTKAVCELIAPELDMDVEITKLLLYNPKSGKKELVKSIEFESGRVDF